MLKELFDRVEFGELLDFGLLFLHLWLLTNTITGLLVLFNSSPLILGSDLHEVAIFVHFVDCVKSILQALMSINMLHQRVDFFKGLLAAELVKTIAQLKDMIAVFEEQLLHVVAKGALVDELTVSSTT